ncbi:MAG: DUF4783 domain-containing protein [Bacteroidales bacterium]|jgi:hypothetical protein|nr:DUF4783 domain-containing protein [Bacteroidales bacterium]
MKKVGLVILALCVFCRCFAQNNSEEWADRILKIFIEEDYSAFGKIFAANVHLSLPAYHKQCSAPQATRILKDFFADKKMVSFEILHQKETPSGAIIVTALFETLDSKYDIFCLFKNEENKMCLTKLTIKKKILERIE